MLPNQPIVGVDEVGRGCLFGPVFAGAVILDEIAEKKLLDAGLKDSKALSASKRASLTPLILQTSTAWALGQASAGEIDLIGIREATERAMLRALQKISHPINLVLVDGLLPLRLWEGPQTTLVRGESHSAAIAAASVLAKEARDSLIKRLAKQYPKYGLEKHVGYGTKIHRESLIKEGPSRLHRRSFLSKIM